MKKTVFDETKTLKENLLISGKQFISEVDDTITKIRNGKNIFNQFLSGQLVDYKGKGYEEFKAKTGDEFKTILKVGSKEIKPFLGLLKSAAEMYKEALHKRFEVEEEAYNLAVSLDNATKGDTPEEMRETLNDFREDIIDIAKRLYDTDLRMCSMYMTNRYILELLGKEDGIR